MRKWAGLGRILRQRKSLCKGPEDGKKFGQFAAQKDQCGWKEGRGRKLVARGGEVGKTSGADPQNSCEGFYSKGTGKALKRVLSKE